MTINLVQSVEPATVNVGGADIARSAPHTLLIQRDGLDKYLMAVLLPLPIFHRFKFQISISSFLAWTGHLFYMEDANYQSLIS